MSIEPVMPHGALTVAEYLEIGEVESGYTELEEGRLVLAASAVPDHGIATVGFAVQLRPQMPPALEIIPDMDVDLELAPVDAPGTVRRPDLMVVKRSARIRVRRDGGVIRASEVVVAIEIISPSSRRLDHIGKRNEYADAGIPHYWIVDLDDPVSLVVCHLAGDFGYVDGGAVTKTFRTSEPFPVEIDLEALLD
jgi:Uma2 family endonuclease